MIVFQHKKTVYSFQTVDAALKTIKDKSFDSKDIQLLEGSLEKKVSRPRNIAISEGAKDVE